jgi:hypothetical protein
LQCLEDIFFALHLPVGGQTARILLVENVEAGQFVQWNARIKNGIRLTTEHFDLVTEVGESLGEMTRVYPLATHVRLASVGEVSNPQGPVGVRGCRHGSQRYRRMVAYRCKCGVFGTCHETVI